MQLLLLVVESTRGKLPFTADEFNKTWGGLFGQIYVHADRLAQLTCNDPELLPDDDEDYTDLLARLASFDGHGNDSDSDDAGGDHADEARLEGLSGEEKRMAMLCRGDHVAKTVFSVSMKEKCHNLWR